MIRLRWKTGKVKWHYPTPLTSVLKIKAMRALMSWDVFVVLSLAGSCSAQRSPCAVCHFPWDSVTDYPCSQARRRITSTWPRDRPRLSFSIPPQNAAPFSQQLHSYLFPLQLSVLSPGWREGELLVFTGAFLAYFLRPRFTDCLKHIIYLYLFYPKLKALRKLCKSLIKMML